MFPLLRQNHDHNDHDDDHNYHDHDDDKSGEEAPAHAITCGNQECANFGRGVTNHNDYDDHDDDYDYYDDVFDDLDDVKDNQDDYHVYQTGHPMLLHSREMQLCDHLPDIL